MHDDCLATVNLIGAAYTQGAFLDQKFFNRKRVSRTPHPKQFRAPNQIGWTVCLEAFGLRTKVIKTQYTTNEIKKPSNQA